MLLALLLAAGCGVFADRQRASATPPAVASASNQPQPAASAEQYSAVEVRWEDRANLQSPATEASLLSEAVMTELRRRDMAHVQASNKLRVRMMEVLLRPGGQMKTGTSVLNARVYVLNEAGSEQWNFPQRTALTFTARSTLTTEQQLAQLYQRFAEQLVTTLQQRTER